MKAGAGERTSKEFDALWTDHWLKSAPAQPATVPAGTILRVDLVMMVGEGLPETEWGVERLVASVLLGLDEVLAGGALYWSPAPGVIDIHYGKLPRKAAELKHAVVISTVERCVRELPAQEPEKAEEKKDRPAGRADDLPTRVDWATFRALCAKSRARPDQIHVIDLGEVLFGAPTPAQRLPRRVWNLVDNIVDEFLATGGYCTHYPGNRLCLLFPGLTRELGEMKRKAIANEIERSISQLVREGEEEGGAVPITAQSATRRQPAREEEETDPAVRHRSNQALAAMASAFHIVKLEPADTELPKGYGLRFAPLWRAANRNLVGQVAEPTVETPGGVARFLPELEETEEPVTLDLPVLARATERIRELVAAQSAYLVNVPVHWFSLERKNVRNKYLQFCSSIPPEVRRFLVLALIGTPDDLLPARVDDRVRQLRPYCRAVTCGVGLGNRAFDHFKTPNVHAVGVDLGREPQDERYLIKAMDKYMDAVQPLRLRTYVYGVTTTSLLIAALASGFDYLSGSAIVDKDDTPHGVREFTIPDIYG